MAPSTTMSYAAAASASVSTSTNKVVASTSSTSSASVPKPGGKSFASSPKPAWDDTPDTGDWSVETGVSPTREALASTTDTYRPVTAKPAWDDSPYWSSEAWASASEEVASTSIPPFTQIMWTPRDPVTEGRFAKFKGNPTTYLECLATCTSAAEFWSKVVPQLDEALLAGYRFMLAYHVETRNECLDYLRSRQVPDAMVIIYFGRDDDERKVRALERKGYKVKYIRGDKDKVEDVMWTDSEEQICMDSDCEEEF